MTISHRERRLKDMIEKERRKQEEWLSGGTAKDFADYKYQTGIIRGLEMGLEFLVEIERED